MKNLDVTPFYDKVSIKLSFTGEEPRCDPLLWSCFGISPQRRLTQDDDASDDKVVDADAGDGDEAKNGITAK